MEFDLKDAMTSGIKPEGIGDTSFNTAIQKLLGEHCRKIQFIDITDDTVTNLFVDASDEWNQSYHEFSKNVLQFVGSPFCHDDDRERFRTFTESASLKRAIEEKDFGTISIVYRRKYRMTDLLYSTVSMELYPSVADNGHLTAILAVQDISSCIKDYNVSLDEGAKIHNRVPGKKTVLIVEDDELNREMLDELLKDDYCIQQAENGAVGLELLQRYMTDISVVILDVQMPVMNGYEFLKYTQKDPFLSKIPVIVATGSNNTEEERICLSLGASDFVSKPYNLGIIKSRLANIIRLRESAATMAVLQTESRTGLYTLQAFYYHVEQLMDKASDKALTVLIFDVERFKNINEKYGDETGNRILQQISGCIKDYIAGADINGRFGEARFLLVREKQAGEDVQDWIEGLFASLKQACEIKEIGFKAGIYDDIDKTLSVSAICDRAIMALNSVGHDINKRYALYDEKQAAIERRLAVMEDDMWNAYRNKQFSVYYQPKHDVRTGKLMGAEALIRWIHPTYGFLSPGEFIPLFERNGFVSYADYYVLERTCSNLRTWMDEGITPVPISVNSSRRDFNRENYVETVIKPLQDSRIDPSLIHIEVTESMFSDNLENISRLLSECRDAGLRIELDDFGSGYSSLTTLTILPLDVMKLDMSFMRNYKDEKKRKVLATCIALAKNLGLKTVCEGVEIEEQRDLLREYGCDLIQGYYFSKPLPENEFREYLIRHQTV